jgi:hypothetical protein
MAYACLTILEVSTEGRKEAAATYRIDVDALRKLRELSSTRGLRLKLARPAKQAFLFI